MQASYSDYSRMLELQADMTFSRESFFYENSNHWREAKNVIDIGCGNCSYLNKLQNAFPDKEYVGVDINEKLLGEARKFIPKKIDLYADLSHISNDQKFDAIILRLVLNTINDRENFFHSIKRFCHPSTLVVVVDAEDRHFSLIPHLHFFMESLKNFRTNASSNGATRKLRDIVPLELSKKGFEKVNDFDYRVNSSDVPKKTMYLYMQATGNLSSEQSLKEKREKDLENWLQDENSKASFGLFMQQFVFRGDNDRE